jgi:Zn-dependent M16 (insulinase) family peptidase
MSHGFKPIREIPIHEIGCRFIEWEHETSKARLIHLKNEDSENVFCLSLSTLPKDNTGVAHILEHMVLCGSKKYPIKDPFFSMIRRSLNTFMNAFTGSDFTCYPAASQNESDFYNLLDVYLDAVFFPNLDARSFMQEGHRLQWKQPQEKKGLERAGIVFNEMKGVYIQPDTHLWRNLHRSLLPQTLYSLDSGGDPEHIPELTHEALIAFHKEYYDPSRCLFYFYGNLPTEKHAAFLENKVLKDRKPLPARTPRTLQSFKTKPERLSASFPATSSDESSNKPMAAVSWLGCDIQNTRELLMMELLDDLLMGHDGAALKRVLMESGISASLNSLFEQEMLQSTYALVFKDVAAQNMAQLSERVLKRLEEIYQEGFDRETIESALHQLKLSRLEITGGGYPFGLILFFRCALLLQQGADGVSALKLQEHLQTLEPLVQDPQELLELMKKRLIDNMHRVELWMQPNEKFNEQKEAAEKKALEKLEGELTNTKKEAILNTQIALERAQNSPEDRSVLPLIQIPQIHRSSQDFPLEKDQNRFWYETFTNGFVYHEAQILLTPAIADNLSAQQWHDLKILAYLWPRLGAGSRTYDQQLELMNKLSAGLGSGIQLAHTLKSDSVYSKSFPLFGFSIHGLKEKSGEFLEFFHETLFKARLDEKERILQLMKQLSSSLQNQLPSSAIQYALNASSQSFGPLAGLSDWMNGVPFLRYVRALEKALETHYDAWIESLLELRKLLLDNSNQLVQAASLEHSQVQAWKQSCERFTPHFKAQGALDAQIEGFMPKVFDAEPSRAFSLNAQVSFNALSLPGPSLMAPESMAVRLGCEIIKQQVLHPEIREKGGAYGYGCAYHGDKQVISFHSYRDPHILRTLQVFHESAQWLAEGKFDQEMIDEAKRCSIQKQDKPLMPGEKASQSLIWKWQQMDLSTREQLRCQMLDTSKEEIIAAAQKWLAPIRDKGITCVFGPEDAVRSQTPFIPQQP